MTQIVPDSEHKSLVSRLPQRGQDLVSLARLDRPIGWWLLFWPCAWGLWLAGGARHVGVLGWLLVGSIAMRGAGCVFNDIVDADIDARVARTALRPIASGRVSKRAAWGWLLALCGVGLVVLLQLAPRAQGVALASLGLVAAYPFMKRITGWPQAWLGLVFTWGAWVGWVQVAGFAGLAHGGLLYAGCWGWCMAYDTIYALQDREDDALVGVGSSALSMGRHVKAGVGALYGLALACWAVDFWAMRGGLAVAALLPVAGHFAWQVLTLNTEDGANALARFRSNRFAGLLMGLACLVVGN